MSVSIHALQHLAAWALVLQFAGVFAAPFSEFWGGVLRLVSGVLVLIILLDILGGSAALVVGVISAILVIVLFTAALRVIEERQS